MHTKPSFVTGAITWISGFDGLAFSVSDRQL